MKRKEFLKICGYTCLGGVAFTSFLSSCGTANFVSAQLNGAMLVVDLVHFKIDSAQKTKYRKYIQVNHENLKFPICIYRFDEQNYMALWLQCTHQGAELQVFGDVIQCPAHGSEFDNKGAVLNGPAAKNLRYFPVIVEEHQLKINLKAI